MAETIRAARGSGEEILLLLHGLPDTSISATLGTKTITGSIGNDGILQIKLPKLGIWHVTAQRQTYSFVQDIEVFQYGITEGWTIINKPFASCTPAEIQAIARSGLAPQYWQIGDKHEITLKTDETIYVKIADFNHDDRPSGEKIPVTIIMENCFNTTRSMMYLNWATSDMRASIIPSIKLSFPEAWQSIMTTAKKKSNGGHTNNTIMITNDDLWFLSVPELYGSAEHGYSQGDEGFVYPIFTDNTSRIARVNGTASIWWTRSPDTRYGAYYNVITAIGSSDTGYGGSLSGVRLGFCVG